MPGTISNVRVGPGWLYVALSLNALEPTDLTTPWATVDALWQGIGYTNEGHSDTYSPSYEGIEVAEEKLPILWELASAEQTVAFAMAELTARNLSIAYNGGTITTTGSGAAQIDTYEPADLSATPVEVKLGWESTNAKERKVWRRLLQVGDVETARRKAPDKAVIPVEFRVMPPLTGAKPFKHIISRPA